jgi:parvulin-like peptidyl-prolyl isomerase
MCVRTRLILAVAVTLILGNVMACGGSGSDTVVVRVGANTLTQAMVDHSIAIQMDEHNGPESEHPGPSRQEDLKHAVTSLISYQWVIGEATELGLQVSDQEVRRQFESERDSTFASESEFRRYLSRSGRTTADELSSIKGALASERILEAVKAPVSKITQAQIVRYYSEHKQQFAVPERRDIVAIRTWTKAAMSKAEREVRSGVSFSSVAKRVSIDRPFNARGGLMSGLIRGQEEKGFDEAIFDAKPNVLTGPLYLRKRYYIFEVRKITPGRQKSLQQVEATIRQQLPVQLERKALGAFIKAWRTKWIAKTNCSPRYIVQKCIQYRPGAGTVPEEPFVLS